MKPDTLKTLEYALKYAKRGWRVIWSHWPIGMGKTARCSCGASDMRDGEEHHAVGKHPGHDWVNKANCDERVIRAWFTVKPDANLSIVTGPESGIFVLDIDPRSGGEDTIRDLATKHGELPATPTFFTGSGGFHLLFKWPDGHDIPTKANIGPGLDTRGRGGQIIAPPSRNVNGYYEIDPDAGLDLEVADAPGWLLALISSSSLVDDDPHRKTRFDIQAALQGAPSGRRDETIFKLACTLRDRGIPEEVALMCARQAAENCAPPFSTKLAEEKVRRAYQKYEPRVDWNREVLQRREAPRQEGREWVQPFPLGAPTGKPLPEGVFPVWLDRFIKVVAQEIQVPTSMVATIALSSISACVAKKGIVRITPSWKETLNLYTVVACPPSSRKSPTFTAVAEPIFEHQKRDMDAYEGARAAAQFEKEGLKMRLEKLKKDFAKTDMIGTVPPNVAAIQMRINDLENVDLPRLIADDVTPEKLAGLLFRNMERIAIMSADGNDIFKQMGAKYKSVADPTIYIKGWSGDTKIVDRMGRTEYLRSPILTMSLAVQPKVMRGVSRSEAADQGLLARILYCYPEDNVGKRKIDFDPYNYDPNSLDFQTRAVYLERLTKLLLLPIPEYHTDTDGKRYDGVNVIAFDDDALKAFIKFEDSLEEERGRTFDDDKREWLGKLGGNVARVIGILHLAENISHCDPDHTEDVWRFPIMPRTVESGVKLGEWFMSHAAAAFEEMQSDPIKNFAIVLVKWIREKELATFYKNEAIQHLSTAGEKASATLTFLCERGYIRTSDPKANLTAHDNFQFDVNPAVLTGDFRSIDCEDA